MLYHTSVTSSQVLFLVITAVLLQKNPTSKKVDTIIRYYLETINLSNKA